MDNISEKDKDSTSSPEDPFRGGVGENSRWRPGNEKYDIEHMPTNDRARRTSIAEGEVKFSKLGWIRLTVCLIVEAIALGMPDSYAALSAGHR